MPIQINLTSTPRLGAACLPTLSTHGYEVIRRDVIPEMSAVLVAFLLR
jgi:hypothetical protein